MHLLCFSCSLLPLFPATPNSCASVLRMPYMICQSVYFGYSDLIYTSSQRFKNDAYKSCNHAQSSSIGFKEKRTRRNVYLLCFQCGLLSSFPTKSNTSISAFRNSRKKKHLALTLQERGICFGLSVDCSLHFRKIATRV